MLRVQEVKGLGLRVLFICLFRTLCRQKHAPAPLSKCSGALHPFEWIPNLRSRISQRFDNTNFSTKRCLQKFGDIEPPLLVLHLNDHPIAEAKQKNAFEEIWCHRTAYWDKPTVRQHQICLHSENGRFLS